jgi:hypothetical protein
MLHRHRLHLVLAALVTLGGSASTALAQSEELKGSAQPGPAAAANAQALKLGEVRVAPVPQQVTLPLSAEEKALRAIEEEGRQQVLELTKGLEGMPDGPARRALEKKAVQLKQDNYIRLLRAKIDFARARGDFAAVQQGEAIVNAILNPHPPVASSVARPAPEGSVVKEGAQK